MKKLLSIMATLLLLTNCAGQDGRVNKKAAGTIIGGLAGAALGSQFGGGTGQVVGVGLGAIAGAFIGNEIGGYMDDQDKMKMENTANNALENVPSGQSSSWKNPDSGNYGTFTPVKTYQRQGQYCREFTQDIHVAGKNQQAYGTACRQADGTWQIVQ